MLNLYVVIYTVVFFVSIVAIKIKKEEQGFKILSFGLLILSLIRFDTGYDFFWYWIVGDKKLQYHPVIVSMFNGLEPGVQYIYMLTRKMGHPQFFFVITGLITFGLIYSCFYRENKNKLLVLCLFVFIRIGFFQANHIIMQYLALSILFFFTYKAFEKNILQYSLIVILGAYLFHSSCILMILLPFIPSKKISLKIIAISNVFIVLFLKYIFPNIVKAIVPQYLYLINYKIGRLTNRPDLISMSLLIVIIVFVEIFQKYPIINKIFYTKNESFYNQYLQNIFLLGFFLSLNIQLFLSGELSRRVGTYFFIYGFLVVSNKIALLKPKYSRVLKVGIISCFYFISMRGILKSGLIYLNKTYIVSEKGYRFRRPNAEGFQIFIGKKYSDMAPYLPSGKKFNRNY